jgi:hypothetical protein
LTGRWEQLCHRVFRWINHQLCVELKWEFSKSTWHFLSVSPRQEPRSEMMMLTNLMPTFVSNQAV